MKFLIVVILLLSFVSSLGMGDEFSGERHLYELKIIDHNRYRFSVWSYIGDWVVVMRKVKRIETFSYQNIRDDVRDTLGSRAKLHILRLGSFNASGTQSTVVVTPSRFCRFRLLDVDSLWVKIDQEPAYFVSVVGLHSILEGGILVKGNFVLGSEESSNMVQKMYSGKVVQMTLGCKKMLFSLDGFSKACLVISLLSAP